jgi:DNA-directed RNA polymerase specialized sigma24 family protein
MNNNEIENEIIEIEPKKKKGVQYFTQETENAIIAYNSTDNYLLKEKIYQDKIHYAFFKLTENIIHTFKFYYTEVENIEDLQHEIITFLLTKMHLFDASKGAKAYSYFGTIVKRYLIISNTKNYKRKVDKVPVEDITTEEKFSYTLEEDNPHTDKLSIFLNAFVEHCTENLFDLFPKENEVRIADAILELFRKREGLNVFNKKALYIYIREMVIDVKTPQITKTANKLYAIFKSNYPYYLETGIIRFN